MLVFAYKFVFTFSMWSILYFDIHFAQSGVKKKCLELGSSLALRINCKFAKFCSITEPTKFASIFAKTGRILFYTNFRSSRKSGHATYLLQTSDLFLSILEALYGHQLVLMIQTVEILTVLFQKDMVLAIGPK